MPEICTKEKEITEVRDRVVKTDTDVVWIKNEMIKMSKKIDIMHDVFTTGEGKINQLNRTVYGNGVQGLTVDIVDIKEQVENLEKDKAEIMGGIKILKIIGSILGGVNFIWLLKSAGPWILGLL